MAFSCKNCRAIWPPADPGVDPWERDENGSGLCPLCETDNLVSESPPFTPDRRVCGDLGRCEGRLRGLYGRLLWDRLGEPGAYRVAEVEAGGFLRRIAVCQQCDRAYLA